MLKLKVLENTGRELHCVVLIGGQLKSNKGINMPYVDINWTNITPKDERDLELINKNNIDWVALSFVQNHNDIVTLWRNLITNSKIMAKIEAPGAFTILKKL